jgi:hypothetical protein
MALSGHVGRIVGAGGRRRAQFRTNRQIVLQKAAIHESRIYP